MEASSADTEAFAVGQQEVSVWLMIDCGQQSALQSHMISAARKYSTPTFTAHVTLVPTRKCDVNASIQHCRSLAATTAGTDDLMVPVLSVETSGGYFDSVYARLENTPALSALHNVAERLFQRNYDFNPHLSLGVATNSNHPSLTTTRRPKRDGSSRQLGRLCL
jgi:2'-5' RNA ligase